MRALRGSVVVLAVALGCVATVPSDVTAQACSQPYQPWFVGDVYSPVKPDIGDWSDSESLTIDMDGDGEPDSVAGDFDVADFGSVVIERGDGTLELQVSGGKEPLVLQLAQPGDLDGDGRDEVIVNVGSAPPSAAYLVPGTLAPGTHDVEDVGILLGDLGTEGFMVGDQDGDGTPDRARRTGDDGWAVYSGAQLLAPGPGGSVPALEPIATYTGWGLSVVEPAPGAPLAIMSVDDVVTVHTDPAVELGAPEPLSGWRTGAVLVSSRADGQVFVSLQAMDRSGASITWNLTNPCSRFDPDTSSTQPTGADPVSGGASYTG